MTKKQIVCCIGFILSACVVLYLLCDLFETKNTANTDKSMNTFRTLNEDTVDVAIVGTSGISRYWIAAKAYEEYGMTSYALSTDGQPTWLYEYLIEEIYAYQKPELLIIDMRPFGQDNTNEAKVDARARRVLDSLNPLSVNRVKAGFKTMEVFHENFEDKPRFDISYLLSVVKYHDQWSDENYSVKDNLFNKRHKYLGFYVNKTLTLQQKPMEKVVYDFTYYEPLNPMAEQTYYDFVDYLKKKDVEVLFVLSPKFLTVTEIGRMNTLMDMLDKDGFHYINYCETDESGDFLYNLNLDSNTDFYNRDHVNYYGAEKFTDVFSLYLHENYDLPDRRTESAVKEQWDGVYDNLKNKIISLENEKGIVEE